ncbi:MAG TPA: hypothetical protein VJ553_05345 [Candidatus Paceibacterota bacterium]|nr:hypothetical protein [Candidatus Paceibacterota bacterium]
MAKFPSTLLPASSDITETRKAILDLLAKINQIAGSDSSAGGGMKSVSTSYTFTPDDGVTDLFVTTGAATITVTLDRSSRNSGRVVRIWKADAGAGEVKIAGNNTGGTAETISGYTNVYVGLQYQHADIYQDGTTNFNIGQYIAPVAGEPSLGTKHWVAYASRSTTPIVDGTVTAANTWSNAVTVSVAPTGAKAMYCRCYRAGQTNPDGLFFEAASGVTLDTGALWYRKYPGVFAPAGGTSEGMVWIPLDSNKQFKFASIGGVQANYVMPPVAYDI